MHRVPDMMKRLPWIGCILGLGLLTGETLVAAPGLASHYELADYLLVVKSERKLYLLKE